MGKCNLARLPSSARWLMRIVPFLIGGVAAAQTPADWRDRPVDDNSARMNGSLLVPTAGRLNDSRRRIILRASRSPRIHGPPFGALPAFQPPTGTGPLAGFDAEAVARTDGRYEGQPPSTAIGPGSLENPFAGDQIAPWLVPAHFGKNLARSYSFHNDLVSAAATAVSVSFSRHQHRPPATLTGEIETIFRRPTPFWKDSGPTPILLCAAASEHAGRPAWPEGRTAGTTFTSESTWLGSWASAEPGTDSPARTRSAFLPAHRFQTAFGGPHRQSLLGPVPRRRPDRALPFPLLTSYDDADTFRPEPLNTISGRLAYFGGLRHSLVFPGFYGFHPLGDVADPRRVALATSRVGLLYQFIPSVVSGYYTISQPYLTNGWEGQGSYVAPSYLFAGEIHKAGLTADLHDGEWFLTASAFYVQNNSWQPPLGSDLSRWGLLDQGRGIELRVSGQLTKRWSTLINVTRIESSRPAGSDDDQLWRVPKKKSSSSAKLWMRYNLVQTAEEKVAVGVGLRLSDRWKSSQQDSLLFPGYSRWDMGFFYERDWLDARVHFVDVLNGGNFSSPSALLSSPEAPLSIEAQIRIRY